MSVPVNKIIPFSSVDGPGNRTAVFLQGCNLNCLYCHNPETIQLCLNCGKCVPGCPTGALSLHENEMRFDIKKCCNCDACIKVCAYNSSPKIRMMTALEVFLEVKKQMPFIRGVTVSGGECTLYPAFLTELFRLCKENGLGTLLDSNGCIDLSQYPDLLALTDGVMLDVKAFDKEEHIKVTGRSNEMVLKNAVYLAQIGKLYEVRTVVVPELFNSKQTVSCTARLLSPWLKVSNIRYKVIAYRPMGVRKEFSFYKIPDQTEISDLVAAVQKEGFTQIITV